MDEARDYELSLSPSTITTTVDGTQPEDSPAAADENRVLTFAELKEFIESGNVDKIPNNKIIPEALNVRLLSIYYIITHWSFCILL